MEQNTDRSGWSTAALIAAAVGIGFLATKLPEFMDLIWGKFTEMITGADFGTIVPFFFQSFFL